MEEIERNVEETLRITLDTVELLIERGETIRSIQDQTSKLSELSRRFLWETGGRATTLSRCFAFLFPTEDEIKERLLEEEKKIF